eukprot:scaffold248664_cov60-Cyclotella_meneghiniana.AAC.1
MSTPKAGGTDPLTSLRKGSVGHTTKLNGSSFTFAVGYHERTIRHNFQNGGFRGVAAETHTIPIDKMLRTGPSTSDIG